MHPPDADTGSVGALGPYPVPALDGLSFNLVCSNNSVYVRDHEVLRNGDVLDL